MVQRLRHSLGLQSSSWVTGICTSPAQVWPHITQGTGLSAVLLPGLVPQLTPLNL